MSTADVHLRYPDVEIRLSELKAENSLLRHQKIEAETKLEIFKAEKAKMNAKIKATLER